MRAAYQSRSRVSRLILQFFSRSPADHFACVMEARSMTKPGGWDTTLDLLLVPGFAQKSGGALAHAREPGRGTKVLWGGCRRAMG